jgi:hypothetical protein
MTAHGGLILTDDSFKAFSAIFSGVSEIEFAKLIIRYLSKNLSKKNICITSCELNLLLFAMFFTLSFKLSGLIIL